MEYPGVEVMLDREMPHTRHKGLPQRSIIGPSRKHFVDRRIVDGRLALGVVRDGQALPLHARVEHPQNEVEDAMIAQFTLGSPLGQREVGQDKCGELGCGELDRIGVVAGGAVVVLILHGPHMKHGDTHWRIIFRQILQ